jgi:streptogramin lyase
VAVGSNAVWVGLSTLRPDVPDAISRVDPRTGTVTHTYPVPEGVRTLVATPHGLWVVHRSTPTLSRVDPANWVSHKPVELGSGDLGAATYGAGAVWVTIPLEDAVARVDDKTGSYVLSRVGRPTGIAARGGQIWVTSYTDHTITRLDPKLGRPVGRPVAVRLNPYALALADHSIWLTAVGRGEIVRLRY